METITKKKSMTERQHRILMARYNDVKMNFFKINLCVKKSFYLKNILKY